MDKKLKAEIMHALNVEGLNVAEETAYKIAKVAFKLMPILIPRVSSGLGGIIVPMMAIVEPKIFALIDEIDGVDSPDY